MKKFTEKLNTLKICLCYMKVLKKFSNGLKGTVYANLPSRSAIINRASSWNNLH